MDLSTATAKFLIENFGIKVTSYIDISEEILQKIGIQLINQGKRAF